MTNITCGIEIITTNIPVFTTEKRFTTEKKEGPKFLEPPFYNTRFTKIHKQLWP